MKKTKNEYKELIILTYLTLILLIAFVFATKAANSFIVTDKAPKLPPVITSNAGLLYIIEPTMTWKELPNGRKEKPGIYDLGG